MAVLIDPPRWPAHGTVFAHLVSDRSLAELHAFARTAGLSRRAFDLDHYDVPAERYDDLVAQGAEAVSGRDLIRRLRASGLRVPSRERPQHARAVLRRRWPHALADAESLGDRLLDRWSEPHRHYHDTTHLLAMLDAVQALTQDPPQTVLLAVWYHDAVYDGVPGQDEEASAQLALEELPDHLDDPDVAEVARLVRVTAAHAPELGDRSGALVSDADLAILGADEHRYHRYTALVRADYAHVGDEDWRRGRAQVLRDLLALDPLYRTTRGRDLWQQQAITNLRRELDSLGR